MSVHFIEEHIVNDLASGKVKQLCLRFPPEPNGYLHMGHAKALYLNYELAKAYKGRCHLRFDDTNPTQESQHYVEAIQKDIGWLGYDTTHVRYSSDHFEALYQYALQLITKGLAYVDDHSSEAFAEKYKGTPTQGGKISPYRSRSVAENIKLFKEMRAGKYAEGSRVLRAKIDMSSPNMHMRDAAIYRIKYATHHRTKNSWVIYPMYDYAHCLCDSLENITHSLCTLEFEVHRPLYEWYLRELGMHMPQQIEYARLNLSHTVLSKRKLGELVRKEYVKGWDDAAMPTLSGLRKRGYTAQSIRHFIKKVGVSKRNVTTDIGLLEWSIRSELNKIVPRKMGVKRPIKLVLQNYEEGKVEMLEAPNNHENPKEGVRLLAFSKEIYIDADDFREEASKRFHRLVKGDEVRLKYAYIIRCEDVCYNDSGEIHSLLCVYDKDTRSGTPGAARKVRGTIGWVEATTAQTVNLCFYAPLFDCQDPEKEGDDWKRKLQTSYKTSYVHAKVEHSVKNVSSMERFQLERIGYFVCETPIGEEEKGVFHQIVGLKENYKPPA